MTPCQSLMIRFTWLKAWATNELPFISSNGSLIFFSFIMSGLYGLNFLYFIPIFELLTLNSFSFFGLSFSARLLILGNLVYISCTPSIKYNVERNFLSDSRYRLLRFIYYRFGIGMIFSCSPWSFLSVFRVSIFISFTGLILDWFSNNYSWDSASFSIYATTKPTVSSMSISSIMMYLMSFDGGIFLLHF